jgi:plasmid stability protein
MSLAVADLIVRNLEEAIVRRLWEIASRDGISAEEAHRRLLRHTLLAESNGRRMTLKQYLSAMPDLGYDALESIEHRADDVRTVDP